MDKPVRFSKPRQVRIFDEKPHMQPLVITTAEAYRIDEHNNLYVITNSEALAVFRNWRHFTVTPPLGGGSQ